MIIKDNILFHKIVPSQGKLMAIDVGTKRIGIATSDETRLLSSPKAIISRQGDEIDFTKIQKLIEENSIKALIIGFPVNMNGDLNFMSDFSKKFADNLDKFLQEKISWQIPIFFADERLSSFEADEIARQIPKRKNQKHHDDIAASVILEDFLRKIDL